MLLDFLFPIRCLGCGKNKTHCCDDCMQKIPRFTFTPAPLMVVPSPSRRAGHINELASLRLGLIAASPFMEKSLLARLIHALKYEGICSIAPPLAKLIPPIEFPNKSVFVPVPLHWRRENIRGFNQSSVLAREIAKKSNRPVCELLKRHRYTRPQVELPRQKRLTNLRGAFSLKDTSQQLDPNSTYFLVDDVSTTGTTIAECKAVLLRHGAKDVRGIVIARTV